MTALWFGRPPGDGLVPVGYRFPLARSIFNPPAAEHVTNPASVPFGMRFFQPTGDVEDATTIPYRYSDRLQVAVIDDDTETPWITVYMGSEPTTTGTSDGKHPRGEELKIDGYAGG